LTSATSAQLDGHWEQIAGLVRSGAGADGDGVARLRASLPTAVGAVLSAYRG